ncbi:MAG: porin [Burkholderiales bacterium]|nr:porin [Burkholderiales bacterium]
MKKTLLALAAFAAASAAFAQSSVTLYGVVDVSVEKVKGDHQVNRVSSDNLTISRIGFKGTEDIGGGLKANFVLESAVGADTGASNTTRFFDRAAWVGLAGGAGELRLGRQDSSIGALAGDVTILGGQNYDDLKIVGTRAAVAYRREDNAITYVLPAVVPGVTAQVQYSTAAGISGPTASISTGAEGTAPYTGNYNKAYGLSVKYAAGPVIAGLGYLNVADSDSATPGDQRANATLVYGGYDLGVAKVIGYFDSETNPSNIAAPAADRKRLSLYGLKAIVPVSADLSVQAGISKAKNVAGKDAGNDDAVITSVKAVYKLSKRTAVYGIATAVNNETQAGKVISGAPALTNKDALAGGVAFGINHAF